MEKRTGTAGTLVAPTRPNEVYEADNAEPGQVEEVKAAQRQSGTGKYGSTKPQAFTVAPETIEWLGKKTTWIEVLLVDKADQPVPGEAFEVTVPGGRVFRGSTDHEGKGRVEGFDPGECTITFPRLDAAAWEAA